MDFDSYNGIKKPGPAEKRDVFGYGHDQPAEAVAADEIAHWSSAAVEIWNGKRHIPHVRPIDTSEPAAGDVMVYGGDGRLYWMSREKAVEAMHCGERILPKAQELSEETLGDAEVKAEELLRAMGPPPRVLCAASPYPELVKHSLAKHPGMEYSGKTHSDEDAVTCGHCGMVFQGGPMHEAKRETFDGGCKAPGYNVVLTI